MLGRVGVDQRRLPRGVAVWQRVLQLVGHLADQVSGHASEPNIVAHDGNDVVVATDYPRIDLGHMQHGRVLA